jgi:hypothetical protein
MALHKSGLGVEVVYACSILQKLRRRGISYKHKNKEG